MEHRSGSQISLSFIFLCVLFSRALALPPLGSYSPVRTTRHADGLFTSGYSKLLGQLSARKYLESLVGKRVGNNNPLEEQMPVKRHADALFTDKFTRFQLQLAAQKYLKSVLAGKRSKEGLNLDDFPDDEEELLEPTVLENDEVTVGGFLNHF